MILLIPAYEPDERLIDLIGELKAATPDPIIVVDDGSGPAYKDLFQAVERSGCTVLTHPANQGKGRALRTGFAHALANGEAEGVVCADCDGQHRPSDILAVAEEVRRAHRTVVLGGRRFNGRVPLRSRFGNTVTRLVFRLATGIAVHDTQTGLRGLPSDTLAFALGVDGDRFEYEMNVLLRAPAAGIALQEVPIDTVYATVHSSHFRTIRDSARVYARILRFAAASLFSALLDASLLFLLKALTGNLLVSVVSARLVSASVNYALNRSLVFRNGTSSPAIRSLPRYAALAALLLVLNFSCLYLLNVVVGVPLLPAKLLTEALLYLFSFWSQRRFVFAPSARSLDPSSSASPTAKSSLPTMNA